MPAGRSLLKAQCMCVHSICFASAASPVTPWPTIGLSSATPRIWFPHWPPVCGHCQSVFPFKLQLPPPETEPTFSAVAARRFRHSATQMTCSRWYSPWRVNLMAPWLDRAQPSDIWATGILGKDRLTKFRGSERGEAVQYQHSHD